LSVAVQKENSEIHNLADSQTEMLNAETVTVIVKNFLKRIGNKGGLKPKRVSLEGDAYIVEVEMKKRVAIVKVDAATRGIKEYELQPKGEETSSSPFSPKTIVFMFGISAITYVALSIAFKMLGL